MTSPIGADLRNPLPTESFPPAAPLAIDGVVLAPSAVKVFKPSGAPACFYDVVRDETRIGIANLILEPDSEKVSEVGHVCVRLLDSHADSDLLQQIAERLISHAHEQGLTDVCIVVPETSQESLQVCGSIPDLCKRNDLVLNGGRLVRFHYAESSYKAPSTRDASGARRTPG